MTSKKDESINSILQEFEEFANLILAQFDMLEKIVASGDTNIPEEIIREMRANEERIDSIEVDLSDKIINTIVLYHPVASEIRKIFTCYRIIISLERVGDMALNIVNYISNISNVKMYAELNDVIANMLMNSSTMVTKALLSFTKNEKEYAIWTIKNDAIVDEMNRKMLKKAIKKNSTSDDDKQALMSLINMNKLVSSIERIADHATNIAEAAIYSIEGKDIRHQIIE